LPAVQRAKINLASAKVPHAACACCASLRTRPACSEIGDAARVIAACTMERRGISIRSAARVAALDDLRSALENAQRLHRRPRPSRTTPAPLGHDASNWPCEVPTASLLASACRGLRTEAAKAASPAERLRGIAPAPADFDQLAATLPERRLARWQASS